MTGVTRQKAEHEGDPLAGLTKRIRVMGMRDETGPGTSKGKGSEGHARNSALCAPEGARCRVQGELWRNPPSQDVILLGVSFDF